MNEIETLEAQYYVLPDGGVFTLPKLYRVDDGTVRLYYTYDLDEDGSVTFFPGVTSLLEETLPTSPYLMRWYADKGYEQAQAYTAERAAYGSFMHSCFAQFLIQGSYDLNKVTDAVTGYFLVNGYAYLVAQWTEELKKDLLAFAQWVQDFAVVPLAVELPLCSRRYGFASLVDLICELRPTKTKPRQMAIVDFKSGKKGNGYLSHELQLAFYGELVAENFAVFRDQDVLLYNWSPKDWRVRPSYTFTNQTAKHTVRELELLSELYYFTHDLSSRTKLLTDGTITLEGDLSTNYTIQSYAEYVTKRRTA